MMHTELLTCSLTNMSVPQNQLTSSHNLCEHVYVMSSLQHLLLLEAKTQARQAQQSGNAGP